MASGGRFKAVLPMSVEKVRAVDVVKCDLTALDVIDEIDRTFRSLRILLTRNGKSAFKDSANPFVKLEIKYIENGVIFVTALLIQKGDCYSFSFFAYNSWRNVSDSPYTLLDTEGRGIQKEQYDSRYSKDGVEDMGLCNLVRAVQSLSSNEPHNWRKWYLHLVHVFIESARLAPLESIARATFLRHIEDCTSCTDTGKDLYGMTRVQVIKEICDVCRQRLLNLSVTPLDLIPSLAYSYRKAWGSLSEALTANGPDWSLNKATAAHLDLPEDESDQKLLVEMYVCIVKIPARLQAAAAAVIFSYHLFLFYPMCWLFFLPSVSGHPFRFFFGDVLFGSPSL